jgi:hypothetical protein
MLSSASSVSHSALRSGWSAVDDLHDAVPDSGQVAVVERLGVEVEHEREFVALVT